jgi:hypothetical protein
MNQPPCSKMLRFSRCPTILTRGSGPRRRTDIRLSVQQHQTVTAT